MAVVLAGPPQASAHDEGGMSVAQICRIAASSEERCDVIVEMTPGSDHRLAKVWCNGAHPGLLGAAR
jgi:hypothetical protein